MKNGTETKGGCFMGCFDLEEMWGVHEECGVFCI